MPGRLSDYHRQLSCRDGRTPTQQLLKAVLQPFSKFYALCMKLRNSAYDRGWCSAYRSRLPVVSVGNLAVGGTGKTPAVDWLIRGFQQRGYLPAVVSRGYGGNYRESFAVVSDGTGRFLDVSECGDEPLLLARRNSSCPVVVARRRADGLRELEKRTDINVIILDDGFQHRSTARDFDLVLLDANDPFGNGLTLPGGKLREDPAALGRAQALLMTRTDQEHIPFDTDIPVFFSRHKLSQTVTALDGAKTTISDLIGKRITAFAGIADPPGFFFALREQGLSLDRTISLSDHTDYTDALIKRLNQDSSGSHILLTTEKDGVKLSADMFKLSCFQIELDFEVTDGDRLLDTVCYKLWSNP